MSINRVALSGNLTRNPELRETSGGTSILAFGIAVNERRKNQASGEWEDYPNFFDCIAFGKRAESLSRILTKGMKVAIDGRLHYSSWENKEGQRRSKVEVIADDIDIMQRKGDQNGSGGSYGGNSGNYTNGGGNARQNGSQGFSGASYDDSADVYDEDIPF